MSKHTPTPWHTGKAASNATIAIQAAKESHIPLAWVAKLNDGEANAALIVRAVNAHEALVSALRAVNEIAPGFHDIEGVSCEKAEGLFNQVRAALALAEKP